MSGQEEYVDIYDAQRRPMGYTRSRAEKLQPGEFIIAVGIWVVNDEGQLLVTRRDPAKRYAPGKWENTGGHVMAGEDCVDALIRELREETGLVVTPDDVRLLGSAIAPPFHGDTYVAYKNADIADIKLQPGETCEARWVSLAELEGMLQRGEMASSVGAHMEFYKEAFYAAVRAKLESTGE